PALDTLNRVAHLPFHWRGIFRCKQAQADAFSYSCCSILWPDANAFSLRWLSSRWRRHRNRSFFSLAWGRRTLRCALPLRAAALGFSSGIGLRIGGLCFAGHAWARI